MSMLSKRRTIKVTSADTGLKVLVPLRNIRKVTEAKQPINGSTKSYVYIKGYSGGDAVTETVDEIESQIED